MKSALVPSISCSVCFAFVLRLNHVTWLSLCACCLCLLCRYPLAPSRFDKLGHENKPPQCQENAKYRASFLWQCLFNQLPLISALHPLFLSFQNVMEEKSAHRQRFLLSTLLLHLHSLVHSSAVVFLALSLHLFHSFLPPYLLSCVLCPFLSHFLILSMLCFLCPSPISLLPHCLSSSLSTLFALQFLHFLSHFILLSLFHLSLLCATAIVLLSSLGVLQCALVHQAAWLKLHKHEQVLHRRISTYQKVTQKIMKCCSRVGVWTTVLTTVQHLKIFF